MIKLLILADDLTGAIDASVQFSKHGMSTLVTIEPTLENARTLDVEVVAVDMEIRHTNKEMASDIVKRLIREASHIGIRWIYLKVDSTLRGNIGSELEAALKANGNDTLYFIPAFPAAKRTTINAIQYVDDVPLNETVYANDPFTPVVSGFIPDIIAEQTDLPIFAVTPEKLSNPNSIPPQKGIVVVDARSEEDLFKIAKILLADNRNTLMAGSAGFAMVLSKMLGIEEELDFSNTQSRTLVICGSLNKTSLKQVAQAEQMGICSLTIPSEQKRDDSYFRSIRGNQQFHQMHAILEQENILILKSWPADSENGASNIPVSPLESVKMDNRQVAQNMGRMIVELIRTSAPDTLIVFGGDTLYGILSQMDGIFINLEKELEPGIVCSRIQYGGKCLRLISKAGGFGDSHTLTSILRYINRQTLKGGVDPS